MWNQVSYDPRSYESNLCNYVYRSLKYSGLQRVWTSDLALAVRRSDQLSYEATDVRSWSFVSPNQPVKEEWEGIFEIFHILNCSPVPELSFLSADIGAEPGRAKRESRITCMRMIRIPPFFPPNRWKNHIWKHVSDSACRVIFWVIIYKQQFLHSEW